MTSTPRRTNRIASCLSRSLRVAANTIGLLGACGLGQSYGQFATIVNVPPNPAPSYIGSNTQVNVRPGGSLGTFVQSGVLNGSTQNIEVNVTGGSIGRGFDANRGTVLNISAGTVGELVNATAGSVVNISGGSVGHSLDAENGAHINVTGGSLADEADVSNAQITVNGGSVGPDLGLFDGSTLNMLSGEIGGGLHLTDSTANISGGTTGGAILLVESVMNVTGGVVGAGVNSAFNSLVNISGGAVGDHMLLQTSSVLNLENGSLGANVELRGDGVVANISGGAVGAGLRLEFGAKVNVSGGSIGTNFTLNRGTANISGGSFEGNYIAADYTTTNLHGSQFVLDGVDVTPTLTVGERFRVLARNVTLSGLLSDGSPFRFDLNSGFVPGEDRFWNSAHVYLHLDPEPGDFNADGLVDGADLLAWQRGESPSPLSSADLRHWQMNFGSGLPTLTAGDFDGDSDVDGADFLAWQRNMNLGDLSDWRSNFGTASAPAPAIGSLSVPEPGAILLLPEAIVSLFGVTYRRRRCEGDKMQGVNV